MAKSKRSRAIRRVSGFGAQPKRHERGRRPSRCRNGLTPVPEDIAKAMFKVPANTDGVILRKRSEK